MARVAVLVETLYQDMEVWYPYLYVGRRPDARGGP